jgi:hypothetical protein
MSNELQVLPDGDDFYKCAGGATCLPSSGGDLPVDGRRWPVGPGDGLLFVR